MREYYHADPATTKGDTSGRYPKNHVKFSPLLAPIKWFGGPKMKDSLLKEFDKPGDLHERWGTKEELAAVRECLVAFSRGCDNNPNLSPIGRFLLKTICMGHLKNRTETIKFYEDNREFIEANGKYQAPIIVTGFPRTGTTLLQRLLSEDPNSRSPFTYEMEKSTPPLKAGEDPYTSPKIKKSEASMGTISKLAKGFMEKFAESHLWSATEKEESFIYMMFHMGLNAMSANSAGWTYLQRMIQPDVAPAVLKYERNFFTMLDAYAPAKSHWANKAPTYAFFFGQIFDVIPDARVVVTHRNPAKNAASIARLMESWLIPFDKDGSFDKIELGRQNTEWWTNVWTRPMEYRAANPERESQIIDVLYADLFADPIGVVKKIYEKYGLDYTQEFEDRMKAYLEDNKQGKYGRHKYSNEEYGIDPHDLRTRFAAYFEKYGFHEEPAAND